LPQISPFSFGDEELNLDETVAATCIITKGDLPVNIWWTLKDEYYSDRNLTTNDGVVITKTSSKISMLNIDAVKARHRGNYTCYASNKAGTVQHSAFLVINGLSISVSRAINSKTLIILRKLSNISPEPNFSFP
jgi:Immunoglobulin domain